MLFSSLSYGRGRQSNVGRVVLGLVPPLVGYTYSSSLVESVRLPLRTAIQRTLTIRLSQPSGTRPLSL